MPAHTLQEGIALLKSGQPEAARQVFLSILKADPYQEEAWLWLAQTVSDPTQRTTVLEKCLSFLPESAKAREALDQLWRQRAPSAIQPQEAPPGESAPPASLAERFAAAPNDSPPAPAAIPIEDQPAPAPDDVKALRESVTRRKISFWRLILSIIAVLVVIGIATVLISSALQNNGTNTPATPQPTPTITLTPTPDAARTATAQSNITPTPAFTPQSAELQAQQIGTWSLPQGEIPASLAFAGEQALAIGSQSGNLRLYSLPEWQLLLEQNLPDGALTSLAVSPQLSDLAAGASGEILYTWSLTTSASLPLQTAQRLELPLPGCGRDELCTPASLVFSPDGNQLILGFEDLFQGTENKAWVFQRGGDETLGAWSLQQQIQNSGQAFPGEVKGLVFLDNGRLLAVSSGQWIVLWQTEDWQPLGSIPEVSDALVGLTADPLQSAWLAGLGIDGRLNIWPLALAKETFSPPTALLLDGHQGRGIALAGDASGAWLASIGEDAVLQIWQVVSSQEVRLAQSIPLPAQPRALAFAPTSLRLAVALENGAIILWELK